MTRNGGPFRCFPNMMHVQHAVGTHCGDTLWLPPPPALVSRFMLEMSGCAEALKCFVTKQDHTEAVLGIPVATTTNPKTGELDYM